MKFPYNRILKIQARFKAGELPREEAKEQLAFVLELDNKTDFSREAHPDPKTTHGTSYGPLVRLSDVCNVLNLWARNQGIDFQSDWSHIELAIDKSNFLARLFFTDEGLRTKMCPTHNGKWSGCWPNYGEAPCACQAGGNVTGWLPTDPKFSDLTYWDDTTKKYRDPEEL